MFLCQPSQHFGRGKVCSQVSKTFPDSSGQPLTRTKTRNYNLLRSSQVAEDRISQLSLFLQNQSNRCFDKTSSIPNQAAHNMRAQIGLWCKNTEKGQFLSIEPVLRTALKTAHNYIKKSAFSPPQVFMLLKKLLSLREVILMTVQGLCKSAGAFTHLDPNAQEVLLTLLTQPLTWTGE